ncbi:MAG: hypothetical protein JSS02_07555 [Planctomycetes bacterium]|nr:hypothetical protein [Planctomycetota bacterium]
MCKKLQWTALLVASLLIAAEGLAVAQLGGIGGGMGGGGMGGGSMQRPKRKLKKSRAPALSPALNLVEGVPTSLEGQFLLRQQPQEEALRRFNQADKEFDKLQSEITATDNQLKTGIKGTGHRTNFMSFGNYYKYPGNGGRR